MTTSDPAVLRWLLEEDQPAVRFRTLTDLLGRAADDPEVVEAHERIPTVGWAAELLRERDSKGEWSPGEGLYQPKYLSTNWKLLVLADLGVTRKTPGVEASCELWMARFATRDGGFTPSPGGRGHLCTTGNTTRALIQFGYEDDPRVQGALDWLVRAAAPLGGWSCWGSGRNLDSWEALSAFAVYPRGKWTREMSTVVERGAEFFLQRELHIQGAPYAPWLRFHYPTHYYYDVLVGLDLLTNLGYGADARLDFGLQLLKRKRGRDGRWNLDVLHPDVEGGIAEYFAAHPNDRPTPWGLEKPGARSKIITLRALRVLARIRNSPPQRDAPRDGPDPRARGRGRKGQPTRAPRTRGRG